MQIRVGNIYHPVRSGVTAIARIPYDKRDIKHIALIAEKGQIIQIGKEAFSEGLSIKRQWRYYDCMA